MIQASSDNLIKNRKFKTELGSPSAGLAENPEVVGSGQALLPVESDTQKGSPEESKSPG